MIEFQCKARGLLFVRRVRTRADAAKSVAEYFASCEMNVHFFVVQVQDPATEIWHTFDATRDPRPRVKVVEREGETLKMRNIRCACGLESQTDASNVGQMMKDTGFFAVFCEDGTIAWFCSACAHTVAEHVDAIAKLSGGNKDLSWSGLLRIAKELPSGEGE